MDWTISIAVRSVVFGPFLVWAVLQPSSTVPASRRVSHILNLILMSTTYCWDICAHVESVYKLSGWRTYLILSTIFFVLVCCNCLLILYTFVYAAYASENITYKMPKGYGYLLGSINAVLCVMQIVSMSLVLAHDKIKYNSIKHFVFATALILGIFIMIHAYRKLYSLLVKANQFAKQANLSPSTPTKPSEIKLKVYSSSKSVGGSQSFRMLGRVKSNSSKLPRSPSLNVSKSKQGNKNPFPKASNRSREERLLAVAKKMRCYSWGLPMVGLACFCVLFSLAIEQVSSNRSYSNLVDKEAESYSIAQDLNFWVMQAWVSWLVWTTYNPLST
ncbi:hypothetical protein AAMO2058_000272500 [Amorphochlora amoebiformis]